MKKRKGFLSTLAVCAIMIYIISTLIVQQVQKNESAARIDELAKKVDTQNKVNNELQAVVDGKLDSEYVGRIARDKLNYGLPGERIFIDVSGK
jgi:cell division protein FtsL